MFHTTFQLGIQKGRLKPGRPLSETLLPSPWISKKDTRSIKCFPNNRPVSRTTLKEHAAGTLNSYKVYTNKAVNSIYQLLAADVARNDIP